MKGLYLKKVGTCVPTLRLFPLFVRFLAGLGFGETAEYVFRVFDFHGGSMKTVKGSMRVPWRFHESSMAGFGGSMSSMKPKKSSMKAEKRAKKVP